MRRLIFLIALIAACTDMQAQEKKSLMERMPGFVRWIAKNWNAKDSTYCYDTFYNWAGQIQNHTSQEFLRLETPEGINVNMESKRANKIGPYFGYRWLFFGNTFDFLARSEGKRRSEFTLSVNSQLFNIDIIRRRTGGDFRITKFDIYEDDLSPLVGGAKVGEDVTCDITGVNINMFLNHKKFSNPAGYSNGAIQLKSVGSPIVGLGFTRHKVTTSFVDRLSEHLYKNSEYHDMLIDPVSSVMLLDMQRMPNYIRINDLHAQVGFAYNWALSRRFLISGTAIVMPSVKFAKYKSDGSSWYRFQKEYRNDPEYGGLVKELEHKRFMRDVEPEDEAERWEFVQDFYENGLGPRDYQGTAFNLNSMFKASMTYNHNRWRAGVVGKLSNYYYSKTEGDAHLQVNNTYYDVSLYVGYCFGRKKQFRYDGEKRNQYIRAALTKREKAEVGDVNPVSNIGKCTWSKNVKYKTDCIDLNFGDCDLVMGEDGRFGKFIVEDGFVTEGMDPDNLVTPGEEYNLDKDGKMEISVGHKMSYRTANWWKSHIEKEQTHRQVYPDMLHYALKGRLELNLRGRVFGTRKPVKLVLDDFYICHGRDGSSFVEFGCKDLRRRSTYSLTGNVQVEGSKNNYRLFLEEGDTPTEIDIYVSRVKERNSRWMGMCDDDKPMSWICIPGTHDAGTSTIPESQIYWTAHTQNFPVIEQTRDGIRCFDIRLKEDMHFGHTFKCLETFDETLEEWDHFLCENPSECIIAMIGSDEGGKWSETMKENYRNLINKYAHRFVDEFDGATRLGDVRGKILIIRRQEACPFGKLLQFEDNAVFEDNNFHVADEYKQFKTRRKLASVNKHIRAAFEEQDCRKWYITFNTISWSPRRHTPYQYANGGSHIRKPMNRSLYEIIEQKDYTEFGIIMLDFYNDHGDYSKLVDTIIEANFDDKE